MELGGQLLRRWHCRRPGRSHGHPHQQFLLCNFNFTQRHSISGSVFLSSFCESGRVRIIPAPPAHGVFGQRLSSHAYTSTSAFQLPHSLSPAEPHFLKARERDRATSLPQRTVSHKRPLVRSSASDLASSDGGTLRLSSKEAHVEQLGKFYEENEFLFGDETWGCPGMDEEGGGGISLEVKEKLHLLVGAGRVQEGSKVLVWGGSPALVQELCDASSAASLVVAHFSMSVLSTVKEMNDDVVCWLGNVEDLPPESYGPFDAVFLNSIVGTAYNGAELLQAVASLCIPGARIVVSSAQGKDDLAVCKDKYPQLIRQSPPNNMAAFEKKIKSLSLNLIEHRDEPTLFFNVLEMEGTLRDLHSQNGSGEESGSTPMRTTSHQVQDDNNFHSVRGDMLSKDLVGEASRWALLQPT